MHLGGAPGQKLTRMSKAEHVDLHRALQDFMEKKPTGSATT